MSFWTYFLSSSFANIVVSDTFRSLRTVRHKENVLVAYCYFGTIAHMSAVEQFYAIADIRSFINKRAMRG